MATNQEKITETKLIKQRINEGNAVARGQMDAAVNVMDPIADADTIHIIKGAKQFYNVGCKDTKLRIDEALETLSPTPTYKLPLELTYHKTFFQVTGCLLPEALFIEDMTDEQWIKFLNWVAKNQHFNTIRCFSWGGWEPVSWSRILRPFIQLPNGKYDIHQLNPKYFAMLDRRLAAAAERNITIILTLIDNCSIKIKAPGHWRMSYWNGDNNVNGTSNWAAMLYHYYEPQHSGKPGAQETKRAIEGYVRLILKRYMKYWPYLIIEIGNEVAAAQGYHQIYSDILDEFKPPGYDKFPKKFKQSSVNNSNWYRDKRLEQLVIPSIHGIGTLQDLDDAILNIAKPNVKYVFSQDGRPPTKTPKESEHLVYNIHQKGHYGFEYNLRPLWEWRNIDWIKNLQTPDWSLEKLMSPKELEWFEAIKRGWHRALNN